MRYQKIRSMDISNGPGARVSIFVQGCDHRCKGCFNSETWDYKYGNLWTQDTNEEILKVLDRTYIRGLSLLGGDPVCAYLHDLEEGKNKDEIYILSLLRYIKENYKDKSIWLWTGYYIEELYDFSYNSQLNDKAIDLIELCDVIVDGPFIQKCLDLNMMYAGSRNQRVIDVQNTLKNKKIKLYEPLKTDVSII